MTHLKRFLFSTLLTASFSAHALTVIVDPGHGGVDKGASRGAMKESVLVLGLAQKIQSLAQTLSSKDLKIILTRESERNIALQSRVNFAEAQSADLFISLHANTSTSPRVSGMEFYFEEKNLAPDPQAPVVDQILADLTHNGKMRSSLTFAKDLQTNMKQSARAPLNETKTVIRRAPFFVIENSLSPSLLVEVGFLSNPQEAARLNQADYQAEIAQTLVKTILDFKERSDKSADFIQK